MTSETRVTEQPPVPSKELLESIAKLKGELSQAQEARNPPAAFLVTWTMVPSGWSWQSVCAGFAVASSSVDYRVLFPRSSFPPFLVCTASVQ